MEESIIIRNLTTHEKEFELTPYIKLKKMKYGHTLLVSQVEGESTYENNILIAYYALQLGLPKVNLRVSVDKDCGSEHILDILKPFNTPLINYYPVKDNEVIYDDSSMEINEEHIQNIKEAHKIISEHSSLSKEKRSQGKWSPSRWQFAHQQYTSACGAISVHDSILSIITGLEALLVKGEGQLTYKVSLYAALILGETSERRKEIFELVKSMYNLRSKVVHGEAETLVKLLSKGDIYQRYFELKSILSNLLIKTYEIEEKELFNRIDEMIFQAPNF